MNRWENKGNKPTRAGFGEGIAEAGADEPKLVILGADITASVGLDLFKERFPERFLTLGIAEQNAMAVAAGLALAGKIPVFSTYAVFAAFRAADQMRISICYNNLHVIIGGAHAGISVGPDGATHQALEDLAIVRCLPNMTVFSPCDATQARQAALAAVNNIHGPVYIRFGREAVPDFISEDIPFVAGQAQVLNEGTDLTLIATGHMVWETLEASEMLASVGISARVINLHTLKPIDTETIIKAAKETGAILTAEEHQIINGLGSAVAEIVVRNHPVPMDFVGINDSFGESGKPSELMKKYGLTSSDIYQKALQLYQRKKLHQP
ncbi:MAG: transketolase family protein [Bacteroidales bacterium]|jgi:transketolase|nr:transketolase family protein [Bacteroidales bacterium]NPV35260.1 transketolase family protein [Bacteroidales bacterium]